MPQSVEVLARSVRDGAYLPLFHPRRMTWQEHFTWSDDATQMLGLTPTGRATIVLLQTNRVGVMNIRRVLTVMGEHPLG